MALSKPAKGRGNVQAHLSLTPEHLMPLLQGVHNWWKGGEYGSGVLSWLGVPKEKREEILEQCGSDQVKAVEECIKWWLQHATNVSWRQIIWSLDGGNETRVADTLRQYAEPLSGTDPSLTAQNVRQVMEVVRQRKWRDVGQMLSVPHSIVDKIDAECSSHNEKISALADYVVTIIPGITWENVASNLYQWGKKRAVERAKPYLHIVPDPTLTTHNVVEMMKGVKFDDLFLVLNVSLSKWREIKGQYQSDEQRSEALIAHTISTHPCMSWSKLARGLQGRGHREAAAEVTRKYVKASEESRELLLKGLKESTSKVRNNIFVFIGAAGSGKTSVMSVMVGEEPPETRESTGCATCPVRGMTTTRISKSGRVWIRIPYSELSRKLATAVKVVAMRRAGSNVCIQIESEDPVPPEIPSSGDPTQPQAEQVHVPVVNEATPTGQPKQKEPTAQPVQPSQIGSDIIEELGSLLEGGVIDESAELFEVDWVNMIDSGGQPAFHELMPFFMHDPSAALFTFKLSEALSSHYEVTYYKDGEPVGEPYLSSLNNEQILSSCMRSITSHVSHEGKGEAAKGEGGEEEGKGKGGEEKENTSRASHEGKAERGKEEAGRGKGGEGERRKEEVGREEKRKGGGKGKGKGTKITFIGTHRDLEESCKEKRDQKEKKLEGMITPSLRPHVLRCGDKFIFAVNAKKPEEVDEGTLTQLQNQLVDNSPAEWKEIPTSYYAIDLALQLLAEKLGRCVLTIEECKREAEKLHMDDKSMMAALRYLHSLNILFFYDDENALPGVVFVNGQVLLDKITELVEKSHQLREKPSPGAVIGGEWEKFHNHAIITRDQLKAFEKHYQEGIFSVDDLIRLFTFKPILAPVGQDRFLIPAILPAEDTQQLIAFIQQNRHLLFFFPHGIAFGVFCALNASVINHAGWSLLEKAGRPVQVSRNCITYTLPDDPGKISLVDTHSNYIAVVFEVDAGDISLANATCKKLCPVVRDTVYTNVRKAVAALHYTNTIPKYAFFCPVASSACSTTSHAAIINSDHIGLTCSLERSILRPMTEQQRMWLPGLQAASSSSGMGMSRPMQPMQPGGSGGGGYQGYHTSNTQMLPSQHAHYSPHMHRGMGGMESGMQPGMHAAQRPMMGGGAPTMMHSAHQAYGHTHNPMTVHSYPQQNTMNHFYAPMSTTNPMHSTGMAPRQGGVENMGGEIMTHGGGMNMGGAGGGGIMGVGGGGGYGGPVMQQPQQVPSGYSTDVNSSVQPVMAVPNPSYMPASSAGGVRQPAPSYETVNTMNHFYPPMSTTNLMHSTGMAPRQGGVENTGGENLIMTHGGGMNMGGAGGGGIMGVGGGGMGRGYGGPVMQQPQQVPSGYSTDVNSSVQPVMAVPNPSYMPASSAGGVRQPAPPYETMLPVTSQPTPSTSSAVLTPSPPPSKNRVGGMAERPTLPELLYFPSGDKYVDIVENISTKYYKFGISLLEDECGNKMAAILEKCREDPTTINREVLRKWINGESKKPVSWATLVSELERCGLTVLAKTIRTSKSK